MTISSKSIPFTPSVGINTLEAITPPLKKNEAAVPLPASSSDQPVRKRPGGAEAQLRMQSPLSMAITAYAHAARHAGNSGEKIQANEKEFRLLNAWLATGQNAAPAKDLTRLLSIPDFLEVDRVVKHFHLKGGFPVPGRDMDGARSAVKQLHAMVWGPGLVDLHPGISELQCDALSLLDQWLREPEPGKPAPGRSLIRLLDESKQFDDLNRQVSLFRNLAEQRWTQNYLTPFFVKSLHELFHQQPQQPDVARLVGHQNATGTHDFVLKQLGAIAGAAGNGGSSKGSTDVGAATAAVGGGAHQKAGLHAGFRKLRNVEPAGYRLPAKDPDEVKALDPLRDLPVSLGESVIDSDHAIAEDGTALR
ncbi:MAG TPA: hypothetical protein VGU61_02295 [Noviherbaspirillum sp.]|jgi:hypothetical protein|uniref:hypothetical protein n=1 Tax=Noviherbaspirillum sp. TaxID=1926288 RepID=UPI002DDCE192|nr:hypothetical protein [Noviherbaspirillum sp.]HEV2609072.1 hypothetical protein [Noviherbaspirillum sp.]